MTTFLEIWLSSEDWVIYRLSDELMDIEQGGQDG
jgi:hypothetical protein